jgi:hypothetical protein
MKSEKLTYVVTLALFVALPSAMASATWYVNGVSGSDSHNCMSSATACKTIGHAISLAALNDTIMVAAATYRENLTMGISLKIIGSSASTTTIDGGGVKTVVTISKAVAVVTLSSLTITHGYAHAGAGTTGGGGVVNVGVLTISHSNLSGNRAQIGCAVPNFCWAFGGGI